MTGPDTQCLTCGDLADLAKAIDNLIASYSNVLGTANEPEDIDRRNEARERLGDLHLSRNRIASEVWRRSKQHPGSRQETDQNLARWFEEGCTPPEAVRTLRGVCIVLDNSDFSCGEDLAAIPRACVFLSREEARSIRDHLNDPRTGL